jgi:hypothetical protein
MKLSFLIALIFASRFTGAQSGIDYSVMATGDFALPANSSPFVASGSFRLDSSLRLQGFAGAEFYAGGLSMALFRSTSSSALGNSLFNLTPGVIELPPPGGGFGSRAFELDRNLSISEASDLAAGNWWLVVTRPEFPNGELRGQIITVPEPESIGLLWSGIIALMLARRRKQRPTSET